MNSWIGNFAWWASHRLLYPLCIRRAWCCLADVGAWWRIAPVPQRPTEFSYRPGAFGCMPGAAFLHRLFGVPPRHFGYDGELDEQGRPHGVGTWNDSARNGEALCGVWRHGQPLGPFRAATTASGYTMSAVRIAYASCRGESTIEDYWYSAPRSSHGLLWGVASIECSTAGRFFKHLPALSHVVGPEHGRSARWCLEQLLGDFMHEAGHSSINVRANGHELHVAGFARSIDAPADSVTIVLRAPQTPPGAPTTPRTLPARNAPDSPPEYRVNDSLGSDPGRSVPRAAEARVSDEEGDDEGGGETGAAHLDAAGRSAADLDAAAVLGRLAAIARDASGRLSAEASLRRSSSMEGIRLSTAELPCSDGAPPHEAERWYHGYEAMPSLLPVGWVSSVEQPQEAVVFFHGFNCPVSDGLKLIGQLWTLGDFPSHLKPWVFGWPGGRDVGYFTAVRRANDPAVAEDFAAFIASLVAAGCRRLHVIAHSMGARLFLSSLPALVKVLKPAPSAVEGSAEETRRRRAAKLKSTAAAGPSGAADAGKLRLATAVLMNPDSPLDKFIDNDFARLRHLCEHITLYADQADGALAWSEIVNRQRSLGKQPFALNHRVNTDTTWSGMVRHLGARLESEMREGMATISRTITGPSSATSPGANSGPRRETPQMGRPAVRRATAAAAAGAAARWGRRGAAAEDEVELNPLDMDVIDVSWMDNNVHSLRHNFWNINRCAADGLLPRAEQAFCYAPSHAHALLQNARLSLSSCSRPHAVGG